MLFVIRRKGNPFLLFIFGIVFIIVSVFIGISSYKEYFLFCNSSDSYKGVCVIYEKGLFGESTKKFPSNQITNIRFEEHVSRSKSGSKSYSYSVHTKLADGNEIQFPPGTTVSPQLRDEIINKFTALKNSGGTIPVYLTHDTRMMAMIMTGIFCLVGIIMIFASLFR